MFSVRRSPPPPEVHTLCIQWPRLGPYHLARLGAAHAWAAAHGRQIVALETAGRDTTYQWESVGSALPFEHVCALPDRTVETAAPREVHAAVQAALDRISPDAVAITSYSTPDAQAALAWCRRHRRPAVCMLASKADDAERNPVREWAKSLLVRQFDAGVGGGTPQAQYLADLGLPPDRIFIPYDVVDNDYFKSGAEATQADPSRACDLPGLAPSTPFFLASNRFVSRKNLPVLIEAYAAYRVRSERPWRLVLLGDGPERTAVEAQAAGVEGVTFAGRQPFAALPAYYGLAGAFVHPALVDQWGLVVNEAMAAGLPVLVSNRAGATADLVSDGETGYAFDPTDVRQLAALLAHVSSLPPHERDAMGQYAQARVADWSPERFAEAVWSAARAGLPTSDRGATPLASVLMWAQRVLTDRTDRLHAIKE